jgi:hypothetical protein
MLSFVIGIVGTAAVFWTLFYTRKAVTLAIDTAADADKALDIAAKSAASTQEAAAAATRGNAIAQESMQRQLRPFLYVGMPIVTYHHMRSVEWGW